MYMYQESYTIPITNDNMFKDSTEEIPIMPLWCQSNIHSVIQRQQYSRQFSDRNRSGNSSFRRTSILILQCNFTPLWSMICPTVQQYDGRLDVQRGYLCLSDYLQCPTSVAPDRSSKLDGSNSLHLQGIIVRNTRLVVMASSESRIKPTQFIHKFRRSGYIVLSLPLLSFTTCLVLTFLYNFEESVATHCKVNWSFLNLWKHFCALYSQSFVLVWYQGMLNEIWHFILC